MAIKTIIFGATGMVGEGVLHETLAHADVEHILVIGRRACGVRHDKLSEILHADLSDVTQIEDLMRGYDACFFCLGVSSVGMKEAEYARITYDLTMNVARVLSRLNPGMTFCYVSGQGTDGTEKGRLRWARVKGKTENDLLKLPFKAAYMFRPGFIKPTKGLKNAFLAARVIGPLYPLLRTFLPRSVCTLRELGLAMIRVTQRGYHKPVIENRDIHSLAAERSDGESQHLRQRAG